MSFVEERHCEDSDLTQIKELTQANNRENESGNNKEFMNLWDYHQKHHIKVSEHREGESRTQKGIERKFPRASKGHKPMDSEKLSKLWDGIKTRKYMLRQRIKPLYRQRKILEYMMDCSGKSGGCRLLISQGSHDARAQRELSVSNFVSGKTILQK